MDRSIVQEVNSAISMAKKLWNKNISLVLVNEAVMQEAMLMAQHKRCHPSERTMSVAAGCLKPQTLNDGVLCGIPLMVSPQFRGVNFMVEAEMYSLKAMNKMHELEAATVKAKKEIIDLKALNDALQVAHAARETELRTAIEVAAAEDLKAKEAVASALCVNQKQTERFAAYIKRTDTLIDSLVQQQLLRHQTAVPPMVIHIDRIEQDGESAFPTFLKELTELSKGFPHLKVGPAVALESISEGPAFPNRDEGRGSMERILYDLTRWETATHPPLPETPADMVNNPPHYNKGGIECIDAIASAVTGLSGEQASLTGHILRYVWRHPHKNGVQDLKKAQWYITRLIKLLSK